MAVLALAMESWPSVGWTKFCPSNLRRAGMEPALRMFLRKFASSKVKLPLIWAEPPVIASRRTGAE